MNIKAQSIYKNRAFIVGFVRLRRSYAATGSTRHAIIKKKPDLQDKSGHPEWI